MKKNIKIVCIIITIFILSGEFIFAQSGIRFPAFEKKLEAYFSKELIEDIVKQTPHLSDFTIWSWDVGDFSNDGVNDLAFVIRLDIERKRIAYVYFFVDIDGFLTKVYQAPFEYIELPLEIGVAIKNNLCYVTKKRKQFDWQVFGYSFINGNFIFIDEFSTEKTDKFTIETYKNYQTLRNYEKYINNSTNKIEFQSDYLTIPSYQRGRIIYYGYTTEAKSNIIEYVPAGAYYWNNENDCSFSVSSVYDHENLYFTIKVVDDVVVGTKCDTCNSEFIEIWLDISNTKEKIIQDKKPLFFQEPDSLVYSFVIYPGDFLEKLPFLKEVNTTDELDFTQTEALKNIKLVATLTKYGYEIKVKIPFAVLGLITAPIEQNQSTTIGCTIVVNDIDNEYRPEESSQIATSSFNPKNLCTYGNLIFIPYNTFYGEISNIYKFDIIKQLSDFGF